MFSSHYFAIPQSWLFSFLRKIITLLRQLKSWVLNAFHVLYQHCEPAFCVVRSIAVHSTPICHAAHPQPVSGVVSEELVAQSDLGTPWTVRLPSCSEAELTSTVPGATETATSALGCEASWVLRDTEAWSYFLLSAIQLKSLGNYWGQYIQLERSVLHLMTALCSRHSSFSSKQ